MYTATITWRKRKSPGGPILATGAGKPMRLDRRGAIALLQAFDYPCGRRGGVAHMYPTPGRDGRFWEATVILTGPDLAALFECTDHLSRPPASWLDPIGS